MKKYLAALLASVLVLSNAATAFASGELTKGEFAQILLEAADDYNPSLVLKDIMADTSEQASAKPVTKAEALVMLRRAFGKIPKLSGDAMRTAPESGTYTDVPVWASDDIDILSRAGLLSETVGGALGADEQITKEYVDTMTARMYRLFGKNKKDDFYYTVNHDFLVSSKVKEGYDSTSSFEDTTNQIGYDIADILYDVIRKNHSSNSIENKIKNFYISAVDTQARNKLGTKPIDKYLSKLNSANSDKDLQKVSLDFAKDTTMDLLAGFSVTSTLEDKNKWVPVFGTYSATLKYEDYVEGNKRYEGIKNYMIKLFKLVGNNEKIAAEKAQSILDFEKELAKHSKDTDEYVNIEDSYNYYTLKQLQGYFRTLDLQAIADVHGFKVSDKIIVADPEAMKFLASYFDGKHTQLLKNLSEISLLSSHDCYLSEEFMQANNQIVEAITGYNPKQTIEYDAFNITAGVMSDYLGAVYYDEHFTQNDESRVKKMVDDILAVYKTRIQGLDWMSDDTKAEAIKKLDNMEVVIGKSKDSSGSMENVKIVRETEDGAFIHNVYNILKENDKVMAQLLNDEAEIEDIAFSSYTVNAMYAPDENAILLPAGILRAPFYDSNASDEQNYATLGYVIGHEISHAFDTTGAKFDENGNYKNWWTDEDYANFEKLSKKAEQYYDGAEAATGLTVNGRLTLDENIADVAGLEAALDALALIKPKPNYKSFFENYAKILKYSANRDVVKYNLEEDSHSPNSVRVNYTVKSTDEFYETYDIQPNDGMYVPKEERVNIW